MSLGELRQPATRMSRGNVADKDIQLWSAAYLAIIKLAYACVRVCTYVCFIRVCLCAYMYKLLHVRINARM